jgi:hypothetical protein
MSCLSINCNNLFHVTIVFYFYFYFQKLKKLLPHNISNFLDHGVQNKLSNLISLNKC